MISIKTLSRQLMSYGMIGGLGLVTHAITMRLFVLMNSNLTLGLVTAVFISTTQNFYLNRRFTFQSSTRNNLSIQYIRYWMAAGLGALVTIVFGTYLIRNTKIFSAHPELVGIACIPPAVFINFSINKLWTFGKK